MDGIETPAKQSSKTHTHSVCVYRCNGNRGWFPSNYVRIIEDYGSTGLVVRIIVELELSAVAAKPHF